MLMFFKKFHFKWLPSYYYNLNFLKTISFYSFNVSKKKKKQNFVPLFLISCLLKKLFEYPFQFFCWLSSHISCTFKWLHQGLQCMS